MGTTLSHFPPVVNGLWATLFSTPPSLAAIRSFSPQTSPPKNQATPYHAHEAFVYVVALQVSILLREFNRDNETDWSRKCPTGVSIPLRGFHGDNGRWGSTPPMRIRVSIPFRGFHGDNLDIEVNSYHFMFQSPFGDSMGITKFTPTVDLELEFQSPFGDSMGITGGRAGNNGNNRFQSPFGDSMGITGHRARGSCPRVVSIPFRGFHGDNVRRPPATHAGAGFNPLSGIPWG